VLKKSLFKIIKKAETVLRSGAVSEKQKQEIRRFPVVICIHRLAVRCNIKPAIAGRVRSPNVFTLPPAIPEREKEVCNPTPEPKSLFKLVGSY
ncbi:MAG: hypothetical protein ACI4QY_00165, partial [Oscillospiraceae bacterium]